MNEGNFLFKQSHISPTTMDLSAKLRATPKSSRVTNPIISPCGNVPTFPLPRSHSSPQTEPLPSLSPSGEDGNNDQGGEESKLLSPPNLPLPNLPLGHCPYKPYAFSTKGGDQESIIQPNFDIQSLILCSNRTKEKVRIPFSHPKTCKKKKNHKRSGDTSSNSSFSSSSSSSSFPSSSSSSSSSVLDAERDWLPQNLPVGQSDDMLASLDDEIDLLLSSSPSQEFCSRPQSCQGGEEKEPAKVKRPGENNKPGFFFFFFFFFPYPCFLIEITVEGCGCEKACTPDPRGLKIMHHLTRDSLLFLSDLHIDVQQSSSSLLNILIQKQTVEKESKKEKEKDKEKEKENDLPPCDCYVKFIEENTDSLILYFFPGLENQPSVRLVPPPSPVNVPSPTDTHSDFPFSPTPSSPSRTEKMGGKRQKKDEHGGKKEREGCPSLSVLFCPCFEVDLLQFIPSSSTKLRQTFLLNPNPPRFSASPFSPVSSPLPSRTRASHHSTPFTHPLNPYFQRNVPYFAAHFRSLPMETQIAPPLLSPSSSFAWSSSHSNHFFSSHSSGFSTKPSFYKQAPSPSPPLSSQSHSLSLLKFLFSFFSSRSFVQVVYTILREGLEICGGDLKYLLESSSHYCTEIDVTQFCRIMQKAASSSPSNPHQQPPSHLQQPPSQFTHKYSPSFPSALSLSPAKTTAPSPATNLFVDGPLPSPTEDDQETRKPLSASSVWGGREENGAGEEDEDIGVGLGGKGVGIRDRGRAEKMMRRLYRRFMSCVLQQFGMASEMSFNHQHQVFFFFFLFFVFISSPPPGSLFL